MIIGTDRKVYIVLTVRIIMGKIGYTALATIILVSWGAMGLDMIRGERKTDSLGKLVNISVSDERFYNARNEKDACGNKLLSENAPTWDNLLSDLNLANSVESGKESLADVVRENGYTIKIPEKYINEKYGCK